MNQLNTLVGLAAGHPAVSVLAAEPTINTTGIIAWGAKYLIPVLFLFAGLGVMAKFAAGRGQTAQAVNTSFGLIIGCVLIAAGSVMFAFGQSLTDLIFG